MKAAAEAVALPDDAALHIASSIKSNVRELESALIQLAAYASLSERRIDLELAQETTSSVRRSSTGARARDVSSSSRCGHAIRSCSRQRSCS